MPNIGVSEFLVLLGVLLAVSGVVWLAVRTAVQSGTKPGRSGSAPECSGPDRK